MTQSEVPHRQHKHGWHKVRCHTDNTNKDDTNWGDTQTTQTRMTQSEVTHRQHKQAWHKLRWHTDNTNKNDTNWGDTMSTPTRMTQTEVTHRQHQQGWHKERRHTDTTPTKTTIFLFQLTQLQTVWLLAQWNSETEGYSPIRVSNPILMSCQSHWDTSGQSNSGLKQMHIWKLLSYVNIFSSQSIKPIPMQT